MKFDYFTRMQSSPQGLPKIYFCAHPADLDAYLNETAKELLALQSCAVWYDAEPLSDYSEDELFISLGTMNLFVVPVTRRLLTESSRAMDVEIEFAKSRHIPILPIIREEELYELYNERFGGIQFLDRTSYDEYAIPYGEKLAKYLSSVIVGDELTAKIRNAFDAYIFLSYRKKDRKQAMELINLIHENDFTRDIAIWYDEYLVPGENFNDAIRAAFEKSSLFVLNVTPSILERTVGDDGKEKKNYVLQTEYPMAVGSHKKILPAETVVTDKEKLSLDYPELPPCIEATDRKGLCSALYNAFEDIALRTNDKEPAHNFFIGLAYLNGIDVEINKPLGVELIRSAAESGLPEAIKKLVSMYEEGDGVKTDLQGAIMWRKKLIKEYEKRYSTKCTEFNGNELFWEIIYLSDALGEQGMLHEQKEKTEYAISVAEEQFNAHNTYNAKRNVYVSYERAGHLAFSENDIKAAKNYFTRAFEAAQFILSEQPSDEAARDTAGMYKKLGNIARAEGDVATAKGHYLKALELMEGIKDRCSTDLTQRLIPGCYEKLGDIAKEECDYPTARHYHRRSLEILKDIADRNNTVIAKRDLSVCYGKLGDVEAADSAPDAAMEHYLQSLELSIAVFDRSRTVESYHDLITAYVRLGNVELQLGRADIAEDHYNRALHTYSSYAKNVNGSCPDVIKRDLWVCNAGLSTICKKAGDFDLAEKYSLDALALINELRDNCRYGSTTVDARRDLSQNLTTLGEIAFAKNETDKAKKYLHESLELRKDILNVTDSLRSRQDLMLTCERLGNVYKADGRPEDAIKHYSESIRLGEEIISRNYTVTVAAELSIIYSNLADTVLATGDNLSAREYYIKSNEIAKDVIDKCSNARTYDILAVSYYKRSFFEDGDVRSDHLKKALEIYRDLSRSHPDNAVFGQRIDLIMQQLENN